MSGKTRAAGTPPPMPDADDEGRPLTPPPGATDAAQLIYLLEWARLRGFRLGPSIKVGEIVLQVQDLRQREGGAGLDDSDPGPWAAAGYEGP